MTYNTATTHQPFEDIDLISKAYFSHILVTDILSISCEIAISEQARNLASNFMALRLCKNLKRFFLLLFHK